MLVEIFLNWFGSWKKGPKGHLKSYTITNYQNGLHKCVGGVDSNNYSLSDLSVQVRNTTGVINDRLLLLIRYIDVAGQLRFVTTDLELLTMLHYFVQFHSGVGYIYLSWEDTTPVTYEMPCADNIMGELGSNDEDWLTEGLYTSVTSDAEEGKNDFQMTEVSSDGSSDSSANEMQCSEENDEVVREDFQYATNEDNEAYDDDESDESDATYDFGSDLDFSSDSEFSWDDKEEYVETDEPFLRFEEEFNNIFANEELEPIEESQMYVDGRIELSVGMIFNTVKIYRDHLRLHAIQHNYEYILKKNEKDRVTAVCAHPPCEWRCHASLVAALEQELTFKVRTMMPKHTCVSTAQGRNKMARSSFVTNMIVTKLRERNKAYSPKEIRVDIRLLFGIQISYYIAWYSRIKALEKVFGSYDQAYADVPELCSKIISTNTKNKAKWAVSVGRGFQSLFVCFHVAAQAWRLNCRPVIGLDGCFLKGKYGGVLLSATGIDGNGGLVPIAFSICTGEDKASWKSFLKEMQDVLYREEPLTFYSDRQKGLIQAVNEEFPAANHRFCMRHIYANFEKKFKGPELCKLVYAAARACDVTGFNAIMSNLKAQDKAAYAYMRAIKPRRWTRSHWDHTTKFDGITNNMSESFNNKIAELRDLPVTLFVEKYHEMFVTFTNERKAIAEKLPGPLCHAAAKDLERKELKAREFLPVDINQNMVMVRQGPKRWEVDISHRTCDCISWQLTGMPCVHAVVALQLKRLPIPPYYDAYYHADKYVATYAENVRMIPDRSKWNKSTVVVLPPPFRRPRGRPKTKRTKAKNESVSHSKRSRPQCQKCFQFGHNQRSCKKEVSSGATGIANRGSASRGCGARGGANRGGGGAKKVGTSSGGTRGGCVGGDGASKVGASSGGTRGGRAGGGGASQVGASSGGTRGGRAGGGGASQVGASSGGTRGGRAGGGAIQGGGYARGVGGAHGSQYGSSSGGGGTYGSQYGSSSQPFSQSAPSTISSNLRGRNTGSRFTRTRGGSLIPTWLLNED